MSKSLVNVIIITIVVILRFPRSCTLYNADEGYYGIIANDTLDAVRFTTPWIRSRQAFITFTLPFKVAGKNNLLAVHVITILVVAATALVVRRIRREWGRLGGGMEWYWLCRVRPCLPAGDTLAGTLRFSRLFLALSVLIPSRRKKRGLGLDVPQCRAGRRGDFIRQPSAVTWENAGVSRLRLAHPGTKHWTVLAAGSGAVTGFVAVIGGLAWCYRWQAIY